MISSPKCSFSNRVDFRPPSREHEGASLAPASRFPARSKRPHDGGKTCPDRRSTFLCDADAASFPFCCNSSIYFDLLRNIVLRSYTSRPSSTNKHHTTNPLSSFDHGARQCCQYGTITVSSEAINGSTSWSQLKTLILSPSPRLFWTILAILKTHFNLR